MPDTPDNIDWGKFLAGIHLVETTESLPAAISLGTPPDLVFDDEPVETLLYGDGHRQAPSPANIFAPACEAWERIRAAIQNHAAQEALRIAAAVVRDGHDIPTAMREELRPLWHILADAPESPFLVRKELPVGGTGGDIQHLKLLVDLAFDCFVHDQSQRCGHIWQMVADVNRVNEDAEAKFASILLNTAHWWWMKSPSHFPTAARALADADLGAPVVSIGQSPALVFNATVMQGLLSLSRRYSSEGFHQRSRELRDLVAAVVTVSEVVGLTDPSMCLCFPPLVRVLQGEGEYEAAIALSREAITICAKAFGTEHASVAAQLNDLAVLLYHRADYAGAEPLFRRAIEIRDRALGPEHDDTLSSVNNLLRLLEATCRIKEAIPFQKRVLDAQERKLGSEHPDLISALNQYAYSLRKAGLAAEAEPFDRRTAMASVKVLGETHPRTLHRRNNLVLTLILIDKLDEARKVLSDNAHANAPCFENLIPRILFLQYVVELLAAKELDTTNQNAEEQSTLPVPYHALDNRQAGALLGRLKIHFAQNPLPIFEGIAVPWDVGYFLEALRTKLPEGTFDFLTALVAALNDRTKTTSNRSSLDRLETFSFWRQPASGAGSPDKDLQK